MPVEKKEKGENRGSEPVEKTDGDVMLEKKRKISFSGTCGGLGRRRRGEKGLRYTTRRDTGKRTVDRGECRCPPKNREGMERRAKMRGRNGGEVLPHVLEKNCKGTQIAKKEGDSSEGGQVLTEDRQLNEWGEGSNH